MMRVLRVLVAVVCVWAGITLLQAPVAEPQKQVEQQLQFHGAEVGKPIAGIPFEEAMRILERHRAELERLPGVKGVGLATEGIYVYTERPELLPLAIEGLPIKPHPPLGIGVELNHSKTQKLDPLHGGVALLDSNVLPALFGTLTGVGMSQGKPWLIFPAHLLSNCQATPPCQVGSSFLNACPHYGSQTMLQPPQPDTANTVGFTQRWDPVVSSSTGKAITDVAAAFMDNFTNPTTMTTVDGDGSLRTDRRLEGITDFTGMENVPAAGDRVTIVSSQDRVSSDPQRMSHLLLGDVIDANVRVEPIASSCAFFDTIRRNQIFIKQVNGGPFVVGGDSGSPILDQGGNIVGMANWRFKERLPDGRFVDRPEAGGTNAAAIRQTLGFDAWYGTASVPDRTIGVFRPGSHQWVLDNGNGRIDACGTDLRYNDTCLGPLGSTGEYPVVGNWTGRGVYTVGQYRIGTFIPSINLWLLDTNGNGAFNNDCFAPGGDWCPGLSISQPTDIGVVGDWNGDGRIKIGQFRPSTAQWFLDWNGNGVWDGCGVDRCYTFGMPNDRPVVGDWNGTGRTKIGTFRNGTWKADNGNGIPDAADVTTTFGVTGDTPVVGHWSGLTVSQIGIFRFENGKGLWGLDGNNSGTFTNCADDICYVYGVPGDVPVTWRPSTVRAN